MSMLARSFGDLVSPVDRRDVTMRPILRAVLVVALVLIVAFLAFGYWTGESWRTAIALPGTPTVTHTVDAEKAGERGAEVGQKGAGAAEKVERTLDETAITTKIKAKIALDDSIKGRSI